MHILDQIVAHKHDAVASARRRVPETELIGAAEARPSSRSLRRALAVEGYRRINIIAEIKRASPSKGPIRPDLDPADLARHYEKGGAAALSVLTDMHFFQGTPDDLVRARAAISVPVLRKDFIVSTYQIYESAVMGADAVLLIVRILDPDQLRDYIDLARQLGLEALVEVHSAAELEVAVLAGGQLIGINNRDLDTLTINLDTTIRLAAKLDPDHIAVAESGIQQPSDVARIYAAGVHNFLIGTTLMAAPNPAAHLRCLMDFDR